MYAPSSESERLVKELPVKAAVPHPTKDSVGRGDIHCNATTRCGAEATALALMSIVEPTALETDRGQTIAVEPKQDVCLWSCGVVDALFEIADRLANVGGHTNVPPWNDHGIGVDRRRAGLPRQR